MPGPSRSSLKRHGQKPCQTCKSFRKMRKLLPITVAAKPSVALHTPPKSWPLCIPPLDNKRVVCPLYGWWGAQHAPLAPLQLALGPDIRPWPGPSVASIRSRPLGAHRLHLPSTGAGMTLEVSSSSIPREDPPARGPYQDGNPPFFAPCRTKNTLIVPTGQPTPDLGQGHQLPTPIPPPTKLAAADSE